ncbi:MAG: hypothetical protein JNK37_25075 [Verrucomicrobiales bacterium]|nr:hypothetical protein [Verrucomicrobiales bacterium]
MIDFSYLVRGLDGLANAHRGGAMAGHPGAALIAGYCFAENHPGADSAIHRAIERDLERILAGEEAFWIDRKSGLTTRELFEPLKAEPAGDDSGPEAIVEALAGNLGRVRQSGHNVIFATAAVRAFADHPDLATPERVRGVVRLVEGFDQAGPGRGYFGKAVGWKTGGEVVLPPSGATTGGTPTLDAAVEGVVDRVIATAGQHRQGFGGLFHLIDHAAGLVDLDQHGHVEAARAGIAALSQHGRLLDALPALDEELGVLEKADRDPLQPEYWARRESVQWSGWLTHRIKVLHGWDTILPVVESAEKRQLATAAFRYLLA